MFPITISNPQQIYEIFGDIVFNSCFDSGNLAKVQKTSPLNYELWISPDCAGTPKENKHKTWFYFSVAKVPKDTTLNFTIKNMNFQGKLYREGMLPVYRTQLTPIWRRIKHPIVSLESNEKGLEVTFKHTFETNNDTVFFAFTYPWSYSENLDFLDYLSNKVLHNNPNIYFHRETIAYSQENRKIELLTITSYKGITENLEKKLNNLFPTEKPRPKYFNSKSYVIITARVHPGEIPGSFVMNGILKYLCLSSKHDQNVMNLLDNYVFVIIPILNPDGVYRGHYRTDPRGLNLNRFYLNPNPIEHPSIYAVKEMALYLGSSKRLFMYFDLHAHASKKGCFIFGNSLDFKNQVESCLFPKLLGLNSKHFDYEASDFSQKNMFAKDKGDEFTKEGSGRVAIYKATGILYSYTLECNYNIAAKGQPIYEKEEKKSEEIWLTKNELDLDDIRQMEFIMGNNISKIDYLEPESYNIEAFEDIGKGICLSILDLNELNIQRKNLRILRAHLGAILLRKAPFRFDPVLRKILRGLSNPNELKKTIKEIMNLIEKNVKNMKSLKNIEPLKEKVMLLNKPQNSSISGKSKSKLKIININFDEKKPKEVKKISSFSVKESSKLPQILAQKRKTCSLKHI